MGQTLMTVDQALIGVTKLGLDTSPFIYFIERHPVYQTLTQGVSQ